MTQAAKAEAFARLHQGPDVLVLPNAWDAASARVFADAGFPALAPPSAGIAAALGNMTVATANAEALRCKVRLNHSRASRRHAQEVHRPSGAWVWRTGGQPRQLCAIASNNAA